jgi:hypothetical protein
MRLLRRKSKPARMTDAVRDTVERSGPAKTVQGAGMAGRAAGRGGKATAGASVASLIALRKMRQGFKQTVPDP